MDSFGIISFTVFHVVQWAMGKWKQWVFRTRLRLMESSSLLWLLNTLFVITYSRGRGYKCACWFLLYWGLQVWSLLMKWEASRFMRRYNLGWRISLRIASLLTTTLHDCLPTESKTITLYNSLHTSCGNFSRSWVNLLGAI